MKILISNDDGVNSSGILASKRAVEKLGEIVIAAPSSQQSGIGRALTLFEPLRINSVDLSDGSQGFSVSGTPTDAVVLAIFHLMDEKPDLLISGINIGENIGKGELTTSGTIGAAMEAASFGIPSIAISQQVLRGDIKFEEGHIELDYSLSEKILYKLAKKVLKNGLPDGIDLLNLNIPSNPDNEDVSITKLGERMYTPHIETKFDPRGKPYYWIDGLPYEDYEEGTDGYALKIEKRPSLTPLSLDLTSNLDLIKNWDFK
ncbi:MAG: 5'/3'-nucleotidase SurE [Methanobrevibacter sp.]|nr:5'/3'-nucleotidase SurE [Methanobrevibacter sp.]